VRPGRSPYIHVGDHIRVAKYVVAALRVRELAWSTPECFPIKSRGFRLGFWRRSCNAVPTTRMLERICAAVLIVLAASPVTAPFATCDLVELLHSQCASESTASLQALVIKPGIDSEALVVPPLMTRADDVRVALVSSMFRVPAASSLTLMPVVTAGPPVRNLVVHRGLPRTASVLRV